MTDKEEHKVIMDKLEDIWQILNGNGRIGVCAKVSIMWWLMVVVIGTAIKTFLF